MSSPALAASVLRGRQEPRVLRFPPTAVASLAEDAHALWDLTGRKLDPWQEISCEPLYSINSAGLWAAKEYGLVVCRQVGKGEILTEYDLARRLVLAVLDQDELLERKPHLHTAVGLRAPYIDALSLLQHKALRVLRLPADPRAPVRPDRSAWTHALLLTVNGAAAGLQNTG